MVCRESWHEWVWCQSWHLWRGDTGMESCVIRPKKLVAQKGVACKSHGGDMGSAESSEEERQCKRIEWDSVEAVQLILLVATIMTTILFMVYQDCYVQISALLFCGREESVWLQNILALKEINFLHSRRACLCGQWEHLYEVMSLCCWWCVPRTWKYHWQRRAIWGLGEQG